MKINNIFLGGGGWGRWSDQRSGVEKEGSILGADMQFSFFFQVAKKFKET